MNLDDALKWADVFGQMQSDPPDGNAPALLVLAAEVRRLRGPGLKGRCVEAGDDECGQPYLVIHTTREDLMRSRNLIFNDVEVRCV